MQYSQAVLDRYYQPSFVGALDETDPNVFSKTVGTPGNGEVVRIQMKVVDQKIVAICFKAHGSCSTIAAAQFVCEQLLNCHTDKISQLKAEMIVLALNLPKTKIHSALLALDACQSCVV